MPRYAAFLRGINVGGRRRVPMGDLRRVLGGLGCRDVATFLASGNARFEADEEDEGAVRDAIEAAVDEAFGFAVPTAVVPLVALAALVARDPFAGVEDTPTTRRYATFLPPGAVLPERAPAATDGGFRVLGADERVVWSVLDRDKARTPDLMAALEAAYGESVTTRTWDTVARLVTGDA